MHRVQAQRSTEGAGVQGGRLRCRLSGNRGQALQRDGQVRAGNFDLILFKQVGRSAQSCIMTRRCSTYLAWL